MASRTPSRRQGGRRPAASGSSNQMPLILGGLAVVVVVLVVVLANRGKSAEAEAKPDAAGAPAAKSASSAPALTPLKLGAAKSGKTATRPAPPLTADTLQSALHMLGEATALCDAGVKLRKEEKNQEARDKQAAAKDKIEAIKKLLDPAATWQEEADMEGWAQPAEYTTLATFWSQMARLEKKVRMNGGT